MSRQHRHNNSLRRAILAQAGPEAFPYQQATPMKYGAKYDAYGDTTSVLHQHSPGGTWHYPEIPISPSKLKRMGRRRVRRSRSRSGLNWQGFNGYGWVTDIFGPLLGAAGQATGAAITASQQRKMQEATLAYQERVEMERIASEERSRAAEALALVDSKTGGRGMTIALSMGVLAVLGGGAYYIFRKRKKARK